MKIVFAPDAWDDYRWWREQGTIGLARVTMLIDDATRHPFTGLGNPEPLCGALHGAWSRRIDRKHRLVYRVNGTGSDAAIEIIQCRHRS